MASKEHLRQQLQVAETKIRALEMQLRGKSDGQLEMLIILVEAAGGELRVPMRLFEEHRKGITREKDELTNEIIFRTEDPGVKAGAEPRSVDADVEEPK